MGSFGQLGHGDKEKRTSPPALVQALEGKHITQVQCGELYRYTVALPSSGYVLTWGGEGGTWSSIIHTNSSRGLA